MVIICAPKTAPMLLTRNLLYTGITRAKELLIIVGDKKTVSFMIQNVDSKKRNTGLKYKLSDGVFGDLRKKASLKDTFGDWKKRY